MVSGGGVVSEKKQEKVFFDPPLWQQRLQYVATALEHHETIESSTHTNDEIASHPSQTAGISERLEQLESQRKRKRSIKRVVDFGCGEGKLLQYLIQEDGYEQLIGIDVDSISLKEALSNVEPTLGDYANRSFRTTELNVSLFHGSIDRLDLTQIPSFDVAVAIEVIEHLDPDILNGFTEVLFLGYAPRMVIITTPNSDFNAIFNLNKNQFRHWDHRFEFSAREFREWSQTQAGRYGYDVSFDGIGLPPPGFSTEKYGCCTQVAIFRKNAVSVANEELIQARRRTLFEQRVVKYDFSGHKTFPIDNRSLLEKISSEAQYVLGRLSRSSEVDESREEEEWHSVEQLLEKNMGSTLKRYCEGLSSSEISQVLGLSNFFDISQDGRRVRRRISDLDEPLSDEENDQHDSNDEDVDYSYDTQSYSINRDAQEESCW